MTDHTAALAEMLGDSPRPQANKPASRRIRNYKAMGDEKLVRVAQELFYHGEAYDRSVERGSGDPEGDLRVVHALIESRGL